MGEEGWHLLHRVKLQGEVLIDFNCIPQVMHHQPNKPRWPEGRACFHIRDSFAQSLPILTFDKSKDLFKSFKGTIYARPT